MKKLVLLLLAGACCAMKLSAQTVQTITADSVLITNTNDTAELILENSTRSVPGFLYNRWNGRTEFRKALVKVNDSIYVMGADTLKVLPGPFMSLTKDETVPSVKVFAPSVTSAGATLYGAVFAPTYSGAVAGIPFVSADFRKPVVTNAGAYTNTTYAAWFRDYVRFDSVVTFAGGAFDAFGLRTNIIRANAENGTFLIYKPSGNGVAGQLMEIDATYTMRVPGNTLTAGTVFRDTVTFTSGVQDYSQIKAVPALIQQGGASGPLRGLYVIPGLTGVTDFRGVEVAVNAGNGYAFYAPGTAPSKFGGLLQYLGNYAGAYTSRSLVDKGYVDSLATTAGNAWSYATGNAIYHMGSVGIGGAVSADTSIKLTVHGAILAKRIRISQSGSDWPDFVFESGYRKPTVPELREYIHKYNRLPGLPSAAEVAKEGVEVSDMQKALLKKVEELTLLLIDQESTIEKQAARIQQLETKLQQP